MGREGTDARASGSFNLYIVQAVLLCGVETWVAIPRIGRLMGGFHQRVAQWILGKQHWCQEYGTWEYPHLEEVIWEFGLENM